MSLQSLVRHEILHIILSVVSSIVLVYLIQMGIEKLDKVDRLEANQHELYHYLQKLDNHDESSDDSQSYVSGSGQSRSRSESVQSQSHRVTPNWSEKT